MIFYWSMKLYISILTVNSRKNKVLWTPNQEDIINCEMVKFIDHLAQKDLLPNNTNWSDLYDWSIEENETFWAEYLEFTEFKLHNPYNTIFVQGQSFEKARWFGGARLNYSENILRNRNDNAAIISYIEGSLYKKINYNELYEQVSLLRQALIAHGIKAHDRVCAMMPNVPETIIAMLAVVSIGAIWSSCSPDFGEQAVVDRFGQIGPVFLFSVRSVVYKGKKLDCLEKTKQIMAKISSIKKCILLDYPEIADHTGNGFIDDQTITPWNDFIRKSRPNQIIEFEYFGFDHPVFIMFSSGTTGLPKCLVQGPGVLLNHNKEHRLHCQITNQSTVFFYTTCGWMMWNWLSSVLYTGAAIVLYEGNPVYPQNDVLWKIAQKESISVFGCSPKYISLLAESGFNCDDLNLSALKIILTTGAPMTKNLFEYVYSKINKNIQLSSIAGGTDLNGCFALGNPVLPVVSGQLQGPGLGMAVDILDDSQKSIRELEGELVCKKPFPSMPLYFWNDPDNLKYKAAYFEHNPDIWYHGDFAEITENGGMIIYGRSDATLNPGGVRIGTADLYNLLSGFREIEDSIIISQPWKDDVRIILFVKMKTNARLDDSLKKNIQLKIKKELSPRHVPEIVIAVKDIPYTHNGKKIELAVKKTVLGSPVKNTGAMANPESLEYFKGLSELN